MESFTLELDSMAASFYSSPLIGATTTLACFAHEIPHEIADYSILVRSGFTKRQAMQSQFLTAIGAFVSRRLLIGRSGLNDSTRFFLCFHSESTYRHRGTREHNIRVNDCMLTRNERLGEIGFPAV